METKFGVFIWHPASETPKEIDQPIICLTKNKCIKTFKDTRFKYTDYKTGKSEWRSNFGRCIASCTHWAYQRDLIK